MMTTTTAASARGRRRRTRTRETGSARGTPRRVGKISVPTRTIGKSAITFTYSTSSAKTVQRTAAALFLFRRAPASSHRSYRYATSALHHSASAAIAAALEGLGRDLHRLAELDALRLRDALDVRNPRRALAAALPDGRGR